MKNQYFGDINDYRKYGLLRLLINGGEIKTAVCWMLTPDDGRGDGGFTSYLEDSGKWRGYDADLFDHLKWCVLDRGVRHVSEIENSDLLPFCRFQSEIVLDDGDARAAYFQQLMDLARGCELIFFDPDNGIEVRSKPYGRKDSSKYLYWDEIGDFWNAGHSLLIYQHFPHVPRDLFIHAKARKASLWTRAQQVVSFETSHVVFFLLPQDQYGSRYHASVEDVGARWRGEIRVLQHKFP